MMLNQSASKGSDYYAEDFGFHHTVFQILSGKYVNPDYEEIQRVLHLCRKLQNTNGTLQKGNPLYVIATTKENGTIAIALARHKPMF